MRRLALLAPFMAALLAGCAHATTPAMAPSAAGSCRSTSFRWFSPGAAQARARLDSWCNGVGPAVWDAAPHSNPSEPVSEVVRLEDVTFVTWNVHVGNGDLAAFVRDLRAGTLTGGRPVRHFVLMLQEAVREGGIPPYVPGVSAARRIGAPSRPVVDIVRLGRELGVSVVYVPSMRNGAESERPADRGSAILSTLPLSDPAAIELPGERQRRVVVVARLAVSFNIETPLSVAVVHLDAIGAPKRLWIFGTPWMREAQARSLQKVLQQGEFVMGADLNTWHGPSEPAARYLGTLLGASSMSPNRHDAGRRVLDYMFFRMPGNRSASYKVIANDYGSDHHPLLGWISPSRIPS